MPEGIANGSIRCLAPRLRRPKQPRLQMKAAAHSASRPDNPAMSAMVHVGRVMATGGSGAGVIEEDDRETSDDDIEA